MMLSIYAIYLVESAHFQRLGAILVTTSKPDDADKDTYLYVCLVSL